jgi:3-hydroxybutyryl-CoA dehydrogenase
MKVAVFGAGTMGSGIAQVFAAKGHTALMYASSTASAQRHKDKLAASLNKKVAKGKMTQEAADDIMSRILVEEFEGAADADLVIECVAENMAVKKELLGKLDALCKDETIFASNTSSLSITEMGQGLKHHLIGMHFFNPGAAILLGEVNAHHAQLGHLLDGLHGEALFLIDLGGQGLDLVLREIAVHLANEQLFLRQMEIHTLFSFF